MRIVGHRGAPSIHDENTVESIKKAIQLGVDMVEIDIQTTKDGVPIVHHDKSLWRMTGRNVYIPNASYRDIKKIKTRGGFAIPTAKEAIKALGSTPCYLDLKDPQLTSGVKQLLKDYEQLDLRLRVVDKDILLELKKINPKYRLYEGTLIKFPLDAIQFAKKHKLYGVSFPYWFLNPLTYFLARRAGLRVQIFTVNNRWYLWLLRLLRLEVDIATDYPERAIKYRRPIQ